MKNNGLSWIKLEVIKKLFESDYAIAICGLKVNLNEHKFRPIMIYTILFEVSKITSFYYKPSTDHHSQLSAVYTLGYKVVVPLFPANDNTTVRYKQKFLFITVMTSGLNTKILELIVFVSLRNIPPLV